MESVCFAASMSRRCSPGDVVLFRLFRHVRQHGQVSIGCHNEHDHIYFNRMPAGHNDFFGMSFLFALLLFEAG